MHQKNCNVHLKFKQNYINHYNSNKITFIITDQFNFPDLIVNLYEHINLTTIIRHFIWQKRTNSQN